MTSLQPAYLDMRGSVPIRVAYEASNDCLLCAPTSVKLVICKGLVAGKVRRVIDERLSSAEVSPATLVHHPSTLGHDVRIGEGLVICARVRATTNISLGRHVRLNLNTTLRRYFTNEDYVAVNPLVAISGGVTIGTETMLGTRSAIFQDLAVGERSVVGASSCVVRDVPDDTVVKGVPAR